MRVDRPSNRAKDAANKDDEAWSILVNKPALYRHKPSLEEDKESEGPLDRGAIPAERLLNVRDKECPAVLIIGDHHHCSDADQQLCPTKAVADSCGCWSRCLHHVRHTTSRCAPYDCCGSAAHCCIR